MITKIKEIAKKPLTKYWFTMVFLYPTIMALIFGNYLDWFTSSIVAACVFTLVVTYFDFKKGVSIDNAGADAIVAKEREMEQKGEL